MILSSGKSKNKIYAVKRGIRPGIYTEWPETAAQVNGYSGAEFKSFDDRERALDWLADNNNEPTLPEIFLGASNTSPSSNTSTHNSCTETVNNNTNPNDITLHPLQQSAFDKYVAGENVFITGPGGSGKSAVLKTIVEDANKRGVRIQVCGMTGCAAVLLNNCKAKTLHSWSGIGIGAGDIEIVSHRVASNKYKRKNWRQIDLLIIDEVSMMSVKLIELLDMTAKKCRKNNQPFGGLQIIFSGDFYQLPPVGNNTEPNTAQFCFESPIFNTLFPHEHIIYLKHIYRQSDPVYSKILNQIRVGKISNKTIAILNQCKNKPIPDDTNIKPTLILPLKNMVNNINRISLAELDTEERIYKINYCKTPVGDNKTKVVRKISKKQVEHELSYLSSNTVAELKLKKGAQVMCIVNLNRQDSSICNGSQGIITNFDENTGYPVVKFNNGVTRVMAINTWESEEYPGISVQQIPLILSWAITIHKAQGATIEMAEIDVGSSIFAAGQTYVALSRVVSLDGLYLRNFDYSKIKVNKKVKNFYNGI